MVARNVVDSQRRSDPGSIPGGAIKCVNSLFFGFFWVFSFAPFSFSRREIG